MDSIPWGERGESTVTIGGDIWDGVTEIMDIGRSVGGLGCRFRGLTWRDACGACVPTPGLVRPSEVLGRTSVETEMGVKEVCLFSAGVGDPASSLFPRFSNRDRSEDTGLIDDASVPSLFSAIVYECMTHPLPHSL